MREEFDLDHQKLFLAYLISDNDLLSRCQNILDEKYFKKPLRETAKFIKEYATKYADCPSTEQVQAVTGSAFQLIPTTVLSTQKDWFFEQFEKFARQKAMENAIIAGAELLEENNHGEIEKLIKEATSIGLPKNFGTDYFENPRERLEALKNSNGQVSTGWKTIDKKLYGGFNRGELNIFAGGSGSGKSIFLQNLALNWSMQKLNGVYFSLELAEGLCSQRMDAMLKEMPTSEIYKNLDEVHNFIKLKSKSAGRLQVVQLTPGVTVNDLKAWLNEFKIHSGITVDYVIVDYLDLMSPVSVKISAENTFIKDKYVSEELRAMAVQGKYLFCTASQLNRGAVESVEFDHSHISGGLSKIQTADNVIGIFNSLTMRERGRVQLQFMKTRSSSAVGTKIELDFNSQCMRIKDLDEDSPEAPTTADVLHDRLRRQAQTESTSTPSTSTTWERPKAREGFSLETPQSKVEPSIAIRTMDSNNKLNNLLKKS